MSQVIYIELEKNIGRSAIRNLFLEHAKYDNLLFLDCDSIISSEEDFFVEKYLQHNSEKVGVICGGCDYPIKSPRIKFRLRWKYGIKRELKMAEERAKNPYKSFMTSNFMIKKDVLKNKVR